MAKSFLDSTGLTELWKQICKTFPSRTGEGASGTWPINASTADNAQNAITANKLTTTSKTAWGQTYWTSGGIPTTISGDMTSVGKIDMTGNITMSSSSGDSPSLIFRRGTTSDNLCDWTIVDTGGYLTFKESTNGKSTDIIKICGSSNTFNSTVNMTAPKFIGALQGNADSASAASKLSTARNIKITGKVSGNADFDGSANITIATTFDDRIYTTLVPTGTAIPKNADLKTTEYLKVGRYYCSANATAKTLKNCPTADAFMMEVYSPLSTTIDNETTQQYVYRLRKITHHSTGVQYWQYVGSGSTAGTFSYGDWRIIPMSKFVLDTSDTNGGSATLGGSNQPVYITYNGTFASCNAYPTSLPANGGNADTVDGKHASDFATSGHNHDTAYYKKTEVDTKIANLVDSAPEALNTLNELAAALGDDPNFATTIATTIGTKANKDGSNATGTWGINITGNAGSATTATTASRIALKGITTDVTYGSYGGIIQDAFSGPEQNAWHNSIKILHNNSAGYYTQLAHNFTGTNGLWHRRCHNGTISDWIRIIDSDNYNSFSPRLDGTGATGTWGINISGIAASASSVAWGNVSGKPSTFTPSTHTHTSIVTEGDNRAVATKPTDYSNSISFRGLKNNSTLGISTTNGTYSYLVGLRGWSDKSGGGTHELAFNDGGIFRRNSTTSADTWGNWTKLLDSSNYTDYTVKKDGTGATGTWGINISGNAATATTATSATSAGSATTASKLDNVEARHYIRCVPRHSGSMDLNKIDSTMSIVTEIRPSEITTTNLPSDYGTAYGVLLSLRDGNSSYGHGKMQILGCNNKFWIRATQGAGESNDGTWNRISTNGHTHTAQSAGAHTHSTDSQGAHTHSCGADSTNVADVAAQGHTHATDSQGSHAHTALSAGAHTHSCGADSTNVADVAAQGHTHATDSQGGHTHTLTPSGTVTSTFSGSAVTSGTPSNNTTSVATGAHTHGTSTDGSHTHNFGATLTASLSNGVLTLSITCSNSGTATSSAGSHSHTANASTNNTTNRVSVPNTSHTHSVTASGTVTSTFSGSEGTTSSNGAHTHTANATTTTKVTASKSNHIHTAQSAGAHTHSTDSQGAHTHTANATTTTKVTASKSNHSHTAASNGSHTHTAQSAGAHTHSVS